MGLLSLILGKRAPARAVATPVPVLRAGASLAQIEAAEAELLKRPQVPYELTHRFAPGVYLRGVVIPAGCEVTGAEHTTDHFNILQRGRVLVLCGDTVTELRAPCVFIAEAGVRKVVRTLEETEWLNIHPTEETDISKIEAAFVKYSETFKLHAASADALPCSNEKGAA